MPTLHYYDAHCHWQDARLLPHGAQIARELETAGLVYAVVNGTQPADWQQVADLALTDKRVLPAFGLHPWHVNAVCGTANCATTGNAHAETAQETPATSATTAGRLHDEQTASGSARAATLNWGWLDTLKSFLQKFPYAAVGEIGLDNWIEGANKALQREAFFAQLALAAEGNRPVSIHCLRADADLLAALKAAPALPARGIHLHGFAGSVETARQLLDMGAYFSFSEYIAEPKRTKAHSVAAAIPLNRLLAETDAPDMQGPPQWQHYRLQSDSAAHCAKDNNDTTSDSGIAPDRNNTAGNTSPTSQQPMPVEKLQPPPKHPANITAAYACLAELRGLPTEELATTVENNFLHYFGNASVSSHVKIS